MKIKNQFFPFVLLAALLGLLGNAGGTLAGESGSAEKGKIVFESKTCADCHKDGGNLLKPSKPIMGSAFEKKYKDDAKLIAAIRKGVPGSSMKGFKTDEISDADMKDLVTYIRSFSKSKK